MAAIKEHAVFIHVDLLGQEDNAADLDPETKWPTIQVWPIKAHPTENPTLPLSVMIFGDTFPAIVQFETPVFEVGLFYHLVSNLRGRL